MDFVTILTLLKPFLPLLSPLLVAGLKWALSLVSSAPDLPAWSKPLLSMVIGAVIAYLSGGDASASVTIPTGALIGLGGSKARDLAVGRPVAIADPRAPIPGLQD